MSHHGHRRFAVVLAVAASLSIACGAPAPVAQAPTSSPAVPTTAAPPPPPPAVLWPLTGRASESEDDVDRPALAVKIENSRSARPQTGLNEADMVWEAVVEGGITRYVAVYHSVLPADIGPVRSVRPMDAAIAAPLGGLFAFSGGQPDFVAAIGAAGLQVLSHDAGAAGFYRHSSRSAPHNVYADPGALLQQADTDHRAAPAEQFTFATADEQPTAVAAGTPASTVQLALSGASRPRWTWSERNGAWLRAEDGARAVDASGAGLRATNVVVLRVDVVNTRYIDPAGNPVPETVLVGEGEALVASGGHTVTATWSKASPSEPVVLTGPLSSPVRLAPGTTWIELVPIRTGAVSTG